MNTEGRRRQSLLRLFIFLSIVGSSLFLASDKTVHAIGVRSSACHKTDGTFTVCPDGKQEWADVPVTAFQETNAYLYADQADLDPNRATPTSPVDTFMLMYDECGRTTPLGPNEYVLVSFNTVETEDGKEKLEHYNLHLFADGTIIFIEDGVPNPAGRVKEIEGQRGAVGFGRSPNCPFDHVIAEFQIELEEAGGHSYSPDPLFWLSSVPPPSEVCGDGIDNDGDGQIDEGCPSGPKILSMSPSISGQLEMGWPYTINVQVRENTQSSLPISVVVSVDEQDEQINLPLDKRTAGRGDSVVGLRTIVKDIPSGSTRNFPFPGGAGGFPPSYQHSWNWMGSLNIGCIDLLRDFVLNISQDLAIQRARNLFFGELLEVADGTKDVGDAVDVFMQATLAELILLPVGSYRYVADANDGFGTDSQILSSVTVEVPQYKLDALRMYFQAEYLMNLFTFLGGIGNILPSLLAVEAVSLIAGCQAYEIANDPDPNFMVIAAPIPISLPSLDALPSSSGKELAEAWKQVLIYQKALGTSLGRYEGAKAAGDPQWMLRQLTAARDFHAALMSDLSIVRNLTDTVISELEAQGAIVTRTSLAAVKAQLLSQGLPQIEKDILSELGFTTSQIATAATVTGGLMDFMPLNWQGLMRDGTDGIITSIEAVGN